MALRATEQGRRVVVLTIDPARRQAQSMGLTELDNTPRAVAGVEGSGSLDAMMLDMKRTFDELVEAHSDPQRAQQVLDNPFYQALSSSFAGTQEYMAMEKLGQLSRTAAAEGTWDLIVVDTPPSRSAWTSWTPRTAGVVPGRAFHPTHRRGRSAGRGLGKVLGAGMGWRPGR
ncbi:MAG: ArsA-related P-loop ATPase [Candidatus Nanopelagicales bacterium]